MPSEVEEVLFSHPNVQDCIVWKHYTQAEGDLLGVGIVPVGAKSSEVN